MANPIRVELEGALAGHYLVVDDDLLTMGFLEDLQTDRVASMLSTIAQAILESDLPRGHDRAGLRSLKPAQFQAIVNGLVSRFQVPKGT